MGEQNKSCATCKFKKDEPNWIIKHLLPKELVFRCSKFTNDVTGEYLFCGNARSFKCEGQKYEPKGSE